jgi:maltooligosyltrehalose trehalohydrolase
LQFRALAAPEMQARLPNPADPMTFVRSKLDHDERRSHAEEYALHRDLLRIRREDSTIRRQQHLGVDGAVVGAEAFVLRFFGEEIGNDRLLVVNLGRDLHLEPAPEPLIAPPTGASWIESGLVRILITGAGGSRLGLQKAAGICKEKRHFCYSRSGRSSL